MAGREGGGGVVGQSHSNSEEKQTTTDGRTDTDGFGTWSVFVCVYLSQLFLRYIQATRQVLSNINSFLL